MLLRRAHISVICVDGIDDTRNFSRIAFEIEDIGEVQASDGLTENVRCVPDSTLVLPFPEEIDRHAHCPLDGKETP